jgi:hypothetical protein
LPSASLHSISEIKKKTLLVLFEMIEESALASMLLHKGPSYPLEATEHASSAPHQRQEKYVQTN